MTAVNEFAISWSSMCDEQAGVSILVPADICIQGGGFLSDPGLETAIFLSMFLDRRADEGDEELIGGGEFVFGETNLRGWWGNELLAAEGDEYGSRLWLFRRSTLTSNTLEAMQRAVEECLQWLLDSSIARAVDVELSIAVKDRVDIGIVISRNANTPVKFSFVWDALGGLRRG